MKNDNPDQTWDEAYNESKDMYGHPYQELQNYFINYHLWGSVLDLGSGQGRNSIFLSSIGYSVTAIDSSSIGINQTLKKSAKKGLDIIGIVADVLKFNSSDKFDIILFDMLLHSFDYDQQYILLKKYSDYLNNGGVFCIVYPNDMDDTHFMKIIDELQGEWKLDDRIIIYDIPKMEGEDNFTFKMIIVRKIKN